VGTPPERDQAFQLDQTSSDFHQTAEVERAAVIARGIGVAHKRPMVLPRLAKIHTTKISFIRHPVEAVQALSHRWQNAEALL
jgi:hypothetical protein